MKNPSSLGPLKFYRVLATVTKPNKHHWRKVSNVLNNTRRDLRPHYMVERSRQVMEAEKSTNQSMKDMKLPGEVKLALKLGMIQEFDFKFLDVLPA